MKIYATLVILAYVAYCQAADKNYGDYCAKDDKCLGDTTCRMPKSCTYGLCLCKSGYVQNTGNTCKKVVEKKKVGESCTSSSDCMGISVTCSNSKCACNSGYVAQDDKKTCGRYTGMACTATTDCGTNMECKSSKCACKTGYKESEKQCVGYNLGESCANGNTCGYGTCTSNTCSCSNSLVAYMGTTCIHKDAKKDLGEGADCTNYEITSSGKFCKKGLYCNTCPNETSKKVCMSGSPSLKAGLLTATLAALLAFFRL